ncbi:MAG TPA: hypothetical protein VGV91_03965, partial [Rubrobacter sp.]|nr:hypothetical protein [Rubrobacter sp.]
MLLDEYLLEMDSYQRIVEDGTITDDELVEQTQRVASHLRRLEEAFSPHRRRNRGCGDAGVVRVFSQKSGANSPMDTDENKERTTPGEREEVRSTGSGGERTKGRASRPDRGSTRGTSGAVAA